jgi:hypothetical protein
VADFRFGIGGALLVVDRWSSIVGRESLVVGRGSWIDDALAPKLRIGIGGTSLVVDRGS